MTTTSAPSTTRSTDARLLPPIDGRWGSYAVGIIDKPQLGDALVEYVEKIDDTFVPFGGAFLVHGGTSEQVEGAPLGAVVVIGFPERDGAQRWYRSPAYRAIADLRILHTSSQVVIVDGVDATHRGSDLAEELAGPTADDVEMS